MMGLSAQDVGDCGPRHAELVSYLLVREALFTQLEHFENVISGYPGVDVSPVPVVSTLVHLIEHVVFGSAQKQVLRVDATLVVTLVTDKEPVRYFRVMDEPTDAGGVALTPLAVYRDRESPVSACMRCGPLPTTVGSMFIDLRPEASKE